MKQLGTRRTLLYRKNNNITICDLGPGLNRQVFNESDNIIRIDLRKEAEPDIIADIRVLPIKDKCFDIVYCSHVLEHFESYENENIIKEMFRIVKLGGELRLYVPNMEWAMVQIKYGIYDSFVNNLIYGRGDDPFDLHRQGFLSQTVEGEIRKAIGKQIGSFNQFCIRNTICNHIKRYR